MIVYSHRFQGVLQQIVLDLGLEMSVSDANSSVSLADNDKMLTDLAAMMNISVSKDAQGGHTRYTFRRNG